MHPLIDEAELAGRIGGPQLCVLDASWHLPDAGRDPKAEFLSAHIPGARFLDLATLVDAARPGLAMAPDGASLAKRLTALGIRQGDEIVLYDDSAVHSAARAWWLLRLHGIDSRLLDGGLAAWRQAGLPVAHGEPAPIAPPARPVAPRFDAALVQNQAQVLALLDSRAAQLVDARGPGRFSGREPEPRPGIAPGHIPGSANLPYARLFEADGRFKRGAALRAEFDAAGVDWARPLVTTCGSGVTAASVMLGAALLGKTDVALYDGSWSEWGADPATPKATGDA